MIRILVTGVHGQVASALAERSENLGTVSIVRLGRPDLDLESQEAIVPAIANQRPDLIVNAAAYTAVDRAEVETDRAFAINRDGARSVAMAAASLSVPLIHLSTDYVYGGSKSGPYTEADETKPVNTYGITKLEGEIAVRSACPNALILRVSWLFSPYGVNFVKTMLRLGSERPRLGIVDDQVGNPTSALDVADAILSMTQQSVDLLYEGGTFNFCNGPSASWFDFAHAVFEQASKYGHASPQIHRIKTVDFPTPARRPANSRLDTTAISQKFGIKPRSWHISLGETLKVLLS